MEKQPRQMFGGLGSTHKPGFSFISKSLPRNNHNFVKGDFASKSLLIEKPAGYF